MTKGRPSFVSRSFRERWNLAVWCLAQHRVLPYLSGTPVEERIVGNGSYISKRPLRLSGRGRVNVLVAGDQQMSVPVSMILV